MNQLSPRAAILNGKGDKAIRTANKISFGVMKSHQETFPAETLLPL